MVEVVVELWDVRHQEEEARLVHHHHSELEMVSNRGHQKIQFHITEFLEKHIIIICRLITEREVLHIMRLAVLYRKISL